MRKNSGWIQAVWKRTYRTCHTYFCHDLLMIYLALLNDIRENYNGRKHDACVQGFSVKTTNSPRLRPRSSPAVSFFQSLNHVPSKVFANACWGPSFLDRLLLPTHTCSIYFSYRFLYTGKHFFHTAKMILSIISKPSLPVKL